MIARTKTGLVLSAAAFVLASGCKRPAATTATPPPASSPVEEARALLEQGQPDAALAKLSGSADPDALYYQGVAWAKKAETAPLPTPPPAPEGAAPGTVMAAPEFKPEELQAIGFFEQATSARPDHAAAHLAAAELLAPHAVRRFESEQAALNKKRAPVRRGKGAPPEPVPVAATTGGPDYGVDRVIRAYRQATQGSDKATAAAAMVRFCTRVNRLDEASGAMAELVRNQENPEPYIQYGDFLLNAKKDRDGALDQYKQALVWRADDDATRAKIAQIYLAMGTELYDNQQYAAAQTRLKEAAPYVTDQSSPLAVRLREQQAKIDAIRNR